MRIAEIQDAGNGRFLVKFEEGLELKVSVTVLADYELFTGKELDEEQLAEIQGATLLASAKRRALRIIGGRAHSRGELMRKLRDKGESRENAEAAADWLCELGYIDDSEFASTVVRHYAGKGYGKARIKNELYRRYVPRELWDEALAEMPETDGKLDRLLASRLGGAEPSRAELKRATDALMRRGFSWDEISRAVKRYMDTLEENQ